MIFAMAENANGSVMPSFAVMQPGFEILSVGGGVDRPFQILRSGTAMHDGQLVATLDFAGGFQSVVERGPAVRDPRDATADEPYLSPGYARALERQQRRFTPELRLVS